MAPFIQFGRRRRNFRGKGKVEDKSKDSKEIKTTVNETTITTTIQYDEVSNSEVITFGCMYIPIILSGCTVDSGLYIIISMHPVCYDYAN